MYNLETSAVVLAIAVGTYTLVAAAWDMRFSRIPNWLNVTALLLGLVYQCGFHGWAGLGMAGGGFAIGFGTLFALWLTGGGGAGDVKLLGALGAWLGFQSTLYVIVITTLLVGLLQLGRIVVGLVKHGYSRTRRRLSSKLADGTRKQNIKRTVPFAVPVALATWVVGVLSILQSIAAASAQAPTLN